MNDIIKLGLRLFLFSLIAAAALAVTNEVTKGPIAEQKLAAKKAALNTVLPGCDYEQIEYENLADGSELDEIFVGKDASGNVKGYALSASPQGYGGEIPITMGVSSEGYVTQVYVGALQETAGLGSRVGDDAFKEQFIGIAADPDTLRTDVDKISGASVSSGAFLNASEQILAYTKGTLGIEPHAGDKDAILAAAAAANGGAAEEAAPEGGEAEAAQGGAATYEVTGFQPFKVDIEVDGDGKIVSIAVPEHNETPGLGADLIADEAVLGALVGQSIADAKIDVKAGVTLTSNAINDALAQAAKAAGGTAGGAATYEVTGFQPFKVDIEVDGDGKIVSIAVPEHNETPGLGADLIADEAVLGALVGQNIADAKIDVKAGVTLTSNAINDALAQAAKAAGGAEAAAVIPGDPYTVKGMNKFTVYLDVADGKIAGITVPEHNETPGLGADMLTEEALAAYAGADLAEVQVDAKAGVTLTANALTAAFDQAAAVNGIQRSAAEEAAPAEEAEEAPAEETEAPAEEAEAPAAEAEPAAVAESAAKVYEVTGFQPFKVELKVDADGKIMSIAVPEHNETPGLGADLIADEAVLGALVGQSIADAKIDVKAGVTLTSNAINDALAKAAADFGPAAAPAEESAAKVYEVTGFQPFKVEIGLDADGKIVSVAVPEHNETPGLGADLIADEAVLGALVGQSIADAKIDVKAGVTLTSNAFNDALANAAEEAK